MESRVWQEKEWQLYVNNLLATHHSLRKEKYQRIPDRNGDHGLEGVTDTGVGYQAYADQNSKNDDECIRKQKKKIYEDLKKLETYKDWWQEFFGEKKLMRWHLLVPHFPDKEVIKYAKLRARELKKKQLKFLADEFDAWVDTNADYPDAMSMVRSPQLPRRNQNSVGEGDVPQFCLNNPVFVQKMDEKIEKALPTKTSDERLIYRDRLLKWHLDASNYSDDLRTNFQTQWEELENLIQTTGESIETEGILDESPARVRLTHTRKEFETALEEVLPFMNKSDRQALSWGTVARWLGECPLNFQGQE